MRYALYLLMMSMVLLAACGGGDDSDNNNSDNNNVSGLSGEELLATVQAEEALNEENNNANPESSLPTLPPEPTREPLVGETTGIDVTIEPNDIPPIGVLSEASTEDPNPGEEGENRSDFDYIYFQQIQIANEMADRESLIIEIFGDGRVVINNDEETTTTVTQADLDAVAQRINDIDFFNIPSTFITGVPQPAGTYRYRMAVVRGTLERAIQAEDAAMPTEIRQLFASVQSLANPIFNPFTEPSATQVGN